MTNEIVQQPLVLDLSKQYSLDPKVFETTIVNTCFSEKDAERLTREEFYAFLLVCKQHGLNPLLREIYAMRKRGGGIQAVVGIDGWLKLMNGNPAFDGMTFTDHLEPTDPKGLKKELVAITCRIHRKDRAYPTEATEYLRECDQGTEPWKKYPARMLRHKATIQAARLAFSFAGIVDPDEADRIKTIARDTPDTLRSPPLIEGGEPAKRGPGRPRKITAPPAPPEEPTVEATQDVSQEEGEELFEYQDPDSGEIRHVTGPELNRLTMEEVRISREEEQRRAEEAAAISAEIERQKRAQIASTNEAQNRREDEAREKARAERTAKAEALRRQLAELSGDEEPPRPAVTEEQKAANAALTANPMAIPQFLRREKPAVPGQSLPTGMPGVTGPEWPDAINQPDKFLKRFDADLSRLDDGDAMQAIWDEKVEPVYDELFPPDREELQAILRHHTSRVAP